MFLSLLLIFIYRFLGKMFLNYSVVDIILVHITTAIIIVLTLVLVSQYNPFKTKVASFNKNILSFHWVQKYLVTFMEVKTFFTMTKTPKYSTGAVFLMTSCLFLVRSYLCLLGFWEFMLIDIANISIYFFTLLYVDIRNKWLNYEKDHMLQ